MIVGLKKTISLWNYNIDFIPIKVVEPEITSNRLNEGIVAPDGSFWFGTMENKITDDGCPKDIKKKLGKLYRLDRNHTVSLVTNDSFGITNKMVFLGGGTINLLRQIH